MFYLSKNIANLSLCHHLDTKRITSSSDSVIAQHSVLVLTLAHTLTKRIHLLQPKAMP
jgi:hypothetical protein